jgi:Predicted xylanase/chitin deacetylase
MYKYRLTKRGKVFSLIILIIIFMAAGMSSIKISANARTRIYINKSMNSTINSYASSLKLMDVSYYDATNSSGVGKIINTDKPSPVKNINETLSIDVEQAFMTEDKKTVFLTFDDGPSRNITPGVLEVLNKYNVKATFFVLGSLCAKNSSTLKKIEESGNAIGIHTYSHIYQKIYGSVDDFIGEVEKTDNVLKQILGSQFHTRLFRFPGGSSGKAMEPFKKVLINKGYTYIDWNALTGDGESSNYTTQQLVERLKATSKNKNHLVVLMHDSESKLTTLQALPQIIEYLKSKGYEFATLK